MIVGALFLFILILIPTPVECCRLQGFPDDWLDGADGPRYRALGNAVSVPVIEYLGRRIMELDRGMQ